jgi:hypothetical protein
MLRTKANYFAHRVSLSLRTVYRTTLSVTAHTAGMSNSSGV